METRKEKCECYENKLILETTYNDELSVEKCPLCKRIWDVGKRGHIFIEKKLLEHLLNCMAWQKFIHKLDTETQKKDAQEAIDKAYHKARDLLNQPQTQ